MTFRSEELGTFAEIFEGSKAKIRAFPGCQHLELLRDLDQPNVGVTGSPGSLPAKRTVPHHLGRHESAFRRQTSSILDGAAGSSVGRDLQPPL